MMGFENAFWTHLVAALLHTLWIGTVAALGLAAALKRIPSRRSELRYGVAAAALGVIVLGWAVSLAIVEYAPAEAQRTERIEQPAGRDVAGPARQGALPSPGAGAAITPAAAPGRPAAARANAGKAAGGSGMRWTAWLAGGWLIGAGLMLARTARRLAGAGRARRACRPLADEALGKIVDELRAWLGIGRRVAVRVGESEYFPCVVGAVWPAVLLPASLLTGMPPEALRAILAHELAHIRRHDYLVNLIQMLIESLLFFNPGVWWISRQIRIEREACCDALAAGATGLAARDYARALVDFAERRTARPPWNSTAPLAAPAFGEARRPGGLIERIRRLAQPGYRPALRLPWHSFVLLLILAALTLACLKKATDGAVALAVEILTPQQRIEKMAEIQKKYGTENSSDGRNEVLSEENQVTLDGRFMTEDGQPLSSQLITIVISPASMSTRMKDDGSFSVKLHYRGPYTIACKVPGYAQVWDGPYQAEPGGTIRDIRIVLRRAFPGRIQTVDPQGHPIGGTKMNGYFNTPSSMHSYLWSDDKPLSADAQGMATLDGGSTMTLYLKGQAPGYEETEWKDVRLEQDRITTLTMTPAEPAEGVVVAARDGYPVPGAKLHLGRQMGGLNMGWGPDFGPILATTDENGRFKIDNLRKDTKYYFYVEAPGFRREIPKPLTAGQQGLRIEMGPRLYVKGKVLHPELAGQSGGIPSIHYNQWFESPERSDGGSGNDVELDVRDGVGYFEFDKLWAGNVSLIAGRAMKRLQVKEPITDLVWDLKNPAANASGATSATREVVFRFELPAGSPQTTGTLRVDHIDPELPNSYKPDWLPVVGGEAKFKVPVPTKVGYSLDASHGGVAGYWFQEKHEIQVPAGTEPFEVKIPALASGAIYGKVLEADGKPAKGILVSVAEVKRSPAKGVPFLGDLGKNSTSDNDPTYTFNVAPLPLGGTYAVVVRRGATFAVSEPITLTEQKPLWEKTLTLPEGLTVRGRVVDEGGHPLEGIKISLDYENGIYGYGAGDVKSGEDGAFAFEHVNPDVPGKYYLHAEGAKYQKALLDFKPSENALEIRMMRGAVLSGQVINEETGKPLEGAEVYALPQRNEGKADDNFLRLTYSDADEKTNEKGEFLFSRLEAGRRYSIDCRTGQVVKETMANGGQAEKVELRVELSEWEKKRRGEGN